MRLLDRALVRLLPAVPRPVVQRLSSHYIAGPALADACATVHRLNGEGKSATVDVLGEEVRDARQAAAIAREYRDVLDALERGALDASISVKLTAVGLELDRDLCRGHVEDLARAAAAHGRFVRIDMEDSSTTDDTLRLYRELREAGHDNVGIVLQSYLRRTLDDIRALADLQPNVRLCKGIYPEPPDVAFQEFEAVQANFVRALEELLGAGGYVAVATHDEWLLRESLRLVHERGLRPDDYEFQMLLGVREERGDQLVREGHRLRVYVPYGEDWYAYSLRRLQENPRLAGYVAADTVARALGRKRS